VGLAQERAGWRGKARIASEGWQPTSAAHGGLSGPGARDSRRRSQQLTLPCCTRDRGLREENALRLMGGPHNDAGKWEKWTGG
jgi:hypothetical protein